MTVADSRVKFTCPSCSEVFSLEPAEARSFAISMIETAEACEEEMAGDMRRRLNNGEHP